MRLFISTATAALILVAAPALHAADYQEAQPEIIFVTGTGENAGNGAAVEGSGGPAAPFISQRDSRESAEKINAMAEKLADPGLQDGVAAMVERFAGTMLQLPVGQFAEAIETARPGTVKKRIDRDATIADLAGRDADDLPETLGEHSRTAMGMMSGFAKAFAVMLPQFEAMARNMEEGFRSATDN